MDAGMFEIYDQLHWLNEPLRKYAETLRTYCGGLGFDAGISRYIEGLADMYERSTRYVKKPEFNIDSIVIDNHEYSIVESVERKLPFCNLRHFTKRNFLHKQPKVLIIAPLSGHFASLLRDTVQRMLVKHDVYITDWLSARDIPISAGRFTLDTYIDYLIEFLKVIGPNSHVMAVCQPAVQIMALAAVLDETHSDIMPTTIIPIGGPIDPRENKTMVNELAESKSLDWFRQLIAVVPEGHPGTGRRVYPGFMQITAFINMNPHKHFAAHMTYLEDCLTGNTAGIEKHKKFYDEYLSVLDMDEAYFIETIDVIFKKYLLPKNEMRYKGNIVDLRAIHSCAMLTLEGENDDISAPGQTYVAHRLCTNIPAEKKHHYLQPAVGHYGIFSGSKWRTVVAPVVEKFIAKYDVNK